MKLMHGSIIVTLALVVAALVPALGQTDLLKSEDWRTEVRFGIYADDPDGNQDWVREFDGREFDLWALEYLNSYGYNRAYQYWFSARDLVPGDESARFDLTFENSLGLRLSTDSLTHRLDRIPAINPYLANVFFTPPDPDEPVSGIVDGSPFGDAFEDLAEDARLAIDRRVNDFGLKLTPKCGRIALVADWWQEVEGGAQQILFYNFTGGQGPRGRLGSALLIDRRTDRGAVGADVQLGSRSALNYRLQSTEFTENAGVPPSDDNLISNQLRIPDTNTTSNIFKARSRLSDRLYFTGVHIDRDRRNRSAFVPVAYDGHSFANAGESLNNHVEVQATNLALTFLATDTLSFTGRWRRYDLDNRSPQVFELDAAGDPQDTPANQRLSRETESLQLSAAYTGISRTYLRLGFERRDTDRGAEPPHPPHVFPGFEEFGEFEHPMIQEQSESDIWRLSVRYHPTTTLSFAGNFENWDTDHPGYFGSPTDRTRVNLNATYLVRDDLALYGDFSRWKDENEEVRAALPLPTPAADDDEADIRQLAAGQDFENESTTATIGAWYAVNPKLTLDANYAKVKTDAAALWVIGIDPGFPPHLPEAFVPFKADDELWSMGLTYAVNPEWRVYGRFLNSDSKGQSGVGFIPEDLGLTSQLSKGWTPVDVNTKRYTVGFAYQISSKDRLLFDFSVADWKDGIDTDNNGRYNLWRLAWSTRL